MTNLYLIKRGPRPAHHNAPYHEVIICDDRRTAEEEQGWTGSGATVWVKEGRKDNRHGWLLKRWLGLDIDYGHVVRGCELPADGSAGFWRDYEVDDGRSVKDLLPGATWWSVQRMPEWLKDRGVVYPADYFTQQHILDQAAGDGVTGCGRHAPSYWTPEPGKPVHSGREGAALKALVSQAESTMHGVSQNLVIESEGDRHAAKIVSPIDDTES